MFGLVQSALPGCLCETHHSRSPASDYQPCALLECEVTTHILVVLFMHAILYVHVLWATIYERSMFREFIKKKFHKRRALFPLRKPKIQEFGLGPV